LKKIKENSRKNYSGDQKFKTKPWALAERGGLAPSQDFYTWYW